MQRTTGESKHTNANVDDEMNWLGPGLESKDHAKELKGEREEERLLCAARSRSHVGALLPGNQTDESAGRLGHRQASLPPRRAHGVSAK